MRKAAGISSVITVVLCMTSLRVDAEEARWAPPDDPTAKWMVAMEKMWGEGNCAAQPGLKDVIADDFQGTSTNGSRYPKADAITTDPKAVDRECQLGEVKIRFFGDSLAVAYGNESSLRKDKDGKERKRCLAWTDTWLKRSGQWRIIAAQDNVVSCK